MLPEPPPVGQGDEDHKSLMIDAALELASLDWPVFPCVEIPGEKAKSPYTKNGFHDATTAPELIHKWWNYKPQALIGIAIPTEILVIDIDPRHGGSRNILEERVGPLPDTACAWSGRNDGGHHLYFLRPKGDLTGTRLKPLGIDLKDADRGYVIAPPSLHPDTGQPYRWEHEHHIALVPDKLWELLQPLTHDRPAFSPREGDDFSELLAYVAATQEGSRDDNVFWAACRMAEQDGLDGHEDDLIDAALSTGFSEAETRKCIASARRRAGS